MVVTKKPMDVILLIKIVMSKKIIRDVVNFKMLMRLYSSNAKTANGKQRFKTVSDAVSMVRRVNIVMSIFFLNVKMARFLRAIWDM